MGCVRGLSDATEHGPPQAASELYGGPGGPGVCLLLPLPSGHEVQQVDGRDDAEHHLPLAGLPVAVV